MPKRESKANPRERAEDETAEEKEKQEDEEENEDEDAEDAAELQRKLETMPFLARVPKDQLAIVLITISSHFTIEKKLEYLEDFLKKADLAQCERYLKDERCDFLKYAPNPAKRRLAETAIWRKNYAHLEPIIDSWGDGAQTALRFWKAREGLIQNKKTHNLPTLKTEDSPIDSKTNNDKKKKKDDKTFTEKEEKKKIPKKEKDPPTSSTTPSISKKPGEKEENEDEDVKNAAELQERFNTQSLLRGMQSPFDFLKGQDAESISMVHFAIRNFKQNAILTDKTVELWLTDDNKKVYETFKNELQSGIPLELFSLRDSSARKAILQFIQSNVSPEAPRRTLAEVLKITNDMLKDFNSLEKPQLTKTEEQSYSSSTEFGGAKAAPALSEIEPSDTVPPIAKSSVNRETNSLNILLVGETASGKTTFVNGFPNYLQYFALDDALQKDPIVAVRTAFSIALDKEPIPIDINIEPRYKPEEYINEIFAVKGQSTTQNAMVHKFCIRHRGAEKRIHLIDTPGVNDTRGPEQDLTNFYNTVKVIDALGEVHAICVLLKPNESRLTKDLRYTLDTLLVKLPKNVAGSVMFCFTHTEPFEFQPGETLKSLKEYLRELKDRSNVDIQVSEKNIICIDNNCFRFQCTVKEHKGYITKKSMLDRSWRTNRLQMEKMIDYVQTLNPQLTSESADIVRVDSCFQTLIETFIAITKEHANKLTTLKAYLSKPLDLYPDKEHRELEKREEAFAYILLVCASFTEFLQCRSIGTPDYYWTQLQRLMAEEDKMSPYTNSAQTSLVDELDRIAKDYTKTLSDLHQSTTKNECGSATPEEVEKIIRKMRSMKMYGDRIPSVEIFPKKQS